MLKAGNDLRLETMKPLQPVNSTISSEAIDMQSGRDLRMPGHNIASTQDINLNAGHDLSVTTAAGSRE